MPQVKLKEGEPVDVAAAVKRYQKKLARESVRTTRLY